MRSTIRIEDVSNKTITDWITSLNSLHVIDMNLWGIELSEASYQEQVCKVISGME